jgi:glucose-1-phosphate thymidylyltransferase
LSGKQHQPGLKTHGEFSITDALDCMIKKGAQFKMFKVASWYDCGKRETLLESNATLLKKFGGSIMTTHAYENTVIIQPVRIGTGCDIRNSIIGPNVTIGERATIDSSIIKNSIIGSYSNLFDIVLDFSLIGSDTGIRGETRTLNIGDNTDIVLSYSSLYIVHSLPSMTAIAFPFISRITASTNSLAFLT